MPDSRQPGYILLEPDRPPSAALIWLHGLGADGYDFLPVVRQLELAERGVRVILPHAPRMPVTINSGYMMPAWYDIRADDLQHGEDDTGIGRSSRWLRGLIEAQATTGIDAGRILLAGFSQGGAVALHTGLRFPRRLAGILALSTYLPLAGRLADEHADCVAGLPVLFGHGIHDPVVPLSSAERAAARLRELGVDVDFRTYPMEHSVSKAEIAEIGTWLQAVLDLPDG